MIALVFSIGCLRQEDELTRAKILQDPMPAATRPPDQSHAEPPPVAGDLVEPPVSNGENRKEPPAEAEVAASHRRSKVERSDRVDRVAGEAAEQQRAPAKLRTARLGAKKGDDPARKVAASHEEGAPSAPAAVAHATLRFKSEAGATFKLVDARFVMDGAELPTVIKTAERGQSQLVFSGEVGPGRHVIASQITYQGADRAVFSYLKGYTFKVKSVDAFTARADPPVSVTIVCKEKTGFNDPIEKRLFVTAEAQ